MASTTPARILGLSHKGKIEVGYDADLVLMDERYQVQWTMLEGKLYCEHGSNHKRRV